MKNVTYDALGNFSGGENLESALLSRLCIFRLLILTAPKKITQAAQTQILN